jgi:aspartate dehydrogenase
MLQGPHPVLRVGVIGFGAIGSAVARHLRCGDIAGAALAGVLRRRTPAEPGFAPDLDTLLADADVIVEAAGQDALREHGAAVLGAGRDLVVVSAGALADDSLFAALTAPGRASRGRLHVSQGALGGLDVVRAAALSGPLTAVQLTSTKKPISLIQPWMGAELASRLRSLRETDSPVTVYDGPARQAAELFPRNANVAATLALAAGNWSAVRARLIADPTTPASRHVVEFTAQVGEYRFDLGNHPDPDNPATSRLVAYSVLRVLADLSASWRIA